MGGAFTGVGFTIGGSALIKWRNRISQAKVKSKQTENLADTTFTFAKSRIKIK